MYCCLPFFNQESSPSRLVRGSPGKPSDVENEVRAPSLSPKVVAKKAPQQSANPLWRLFAGRSLSWAHAALVRFSSLTASFEISREQFESVFELGSGASADATLQSAFVRLDTQRKGYADAFECFVCVCLFACSEPDYRLRFLYGLFDLHGTNWLTAKELQMAVKCCYVCLAKMGAVLPARAFEDGVHRKIVRNGIRVLRGSAGHSHAPASEDKVNGMTSDEFVSWVLGKLHGRTVSFWKGVQNLQLRMLGAQ